MFIRDTAVYRAEQNAAFEPARSDQIVEKFRMKETSHVFVSYRGSQRDLAVRVSDAAEATGWVAETITVDLKCPFPAGSANEFMWLTDRFSERIELGCTFVMMASDDANESRWVLWEGLEGFTKAYRIIVCWLSGTDPLKIVFPLSRLYYRMMLSPQAFIVDARGDPKRAVLAVTKILSPSLRYRILLRVQQVAIALVCIALLLSPVTILLATSALPFSTAHSIRSVLLRPWVCLLSLWISMVVIGVFYPSYGGPSRTAPDRIDKHIRLVTPGFTGWRWKNMIFPASFIFACMIDGVKVFSLHSMSTIGWGTWLKAFIFTVILGWCYQRMQWNLFTMHLGVLYRRLKKAYGFDDAA
jgi:hypothetical protein